jgi:hypothetical protein
MEMIIDKNGKRRQALPGELLQDGERVVVTLNLMDHTRPVLHDGMGGVAGHRPGYIFAHDPEASGGNALDSAQREYTARLTNAWRAPAGEHARHAADAGANPQAAYEKWLANAWRSR